MIRDTCSGKSLGPILVVDVIILGGVCHYAFYSPIVNLPSFSADYGIPNA